MMLISEQEYSTSSVQGMEGGGGTFTLPLHSPKLTAGTEGTLLTIGVGLCVLPHMDLCFFSPNDTILNIQKK